LRLLPEVGFRVRQRGLRAKTGEHYRHYKMHLDEKPSFWLTSYKLADRDLQYRNTGRARTIFRLFRLTEICNRRE